MTVTQGKTVQSDGEYLIAARAVDMDLSTHAVTGTDGDKGWLKLEFDKTYLIHKVVIYYRFYTDWYNPDDGCVQNEERFRRCTNLDSYVDVSVFFGEVKRKSCGTLQLTYGLEQSDQIYTLFCNAKGDTVKLSKGHGNIAVFEIAITRSTCTENLS